MPNAINAHPVNMRACVCARVFKKSIDEKKESD